MGSYIKVSYREDGRCSVFCICPLFVSAARTGKGPNCSLRGSWQIDGLGVRTVNPMSRSQLRPLNSNWATTWFSHREIELKNAIAIGKENEIIAFAFLQVFNLRQVFIQI